MKGFKKKKKEMKMRKIKIMFKNDFYFIIEAFKLTCVPLFCPVFKRIHAKLLMGANSVLPVMEDPEFQHLKHKT